MFARRPPPLGPRCAPGSGRAGRAGRGPGPGPGPEPGPGTGLRGARQPARTRPARPHKRGARCRAAPGAARRPAGRRARVCRGSGPRGTQKGGWTRGAAGGEPRPHRRDPRPPSGLYVSAPGGAASARQPGPPAPAAEGGPGTAGEGGPGTPLPGEKKWSGESCWGREGPEDPARRGGSGDLQERVGWGDPAKGESGLGDPLKGRR